MDNPNLRNTMYIVAKNPHHKILNTIVYAVMEAAYKLPASIIFCFTSSGSAALKISKLRPPCSVIAITSNIVLARVMNFLRGVKGYHV